MLKNFILYISMGLATTNALAVCNYVVLNETDTKFENNTSSRQLDGLAVAPLCADLPDSLKKHTYKEYCDTNSEKVQYDEYKTIYGPYTTSSCKNLVGTKWSVQNKSGILGTHVINESDLKDDQTIMLNYPSQFKQ